MVELTKREYAVFCCVHQFFIDHDESPTRREIGELLRIAPQTVHKHLTHLARKKFIALKPNAQRNITLLRHEYRRQPKLL